MKLRTVKFKINGQERSEQTDPAVASFVGRIRLALSFALSLRRMRRPAAVGACLSKNRHAKENVLSGIPETRALATCIKLEQLIHELIIPAQFAGRSPEDLFNAAANREIGLRSTEREQGEWIRDLCTPSSFPNPLLSQVSKRKQSADSMLCGKGPADSAPGGD